MRKFRLKIGVDVDDVLFSCNAYAIELANKEHHYDPPIELKEITLWGKTGTRVDERLAYYEKEEARGEIVVVIATPSAREENMDVEALLTEALKDHSARDASAIVAARTGLPKREIYARAISLGRTRS